MIRPQLKKLHDPAQSVVTACVDGWRVLQNRGPSALQFWLIALLVGIAAGFGASFFRMAIESLQTALYRTDQVAALISAAERLPWYWIVAVPVLGGLLAGILLDRFTNDGVVRSVAHVIEGAAIHEGRVEHRAGLGSFLASFVTLSTGGSSGREGPVVHMAAMISSWVSQRIGASGMTARDLLGCAVAAAVSASFNAPIAGALFALEVVLRHFAVHAFAPITIAAVAGTVINRLQFGGLTEFNLGTDSAQAFYVELPAFLILGLVCGLVAVILMRAIFLADDFGTWVQRRTGMRRYLRPAIAGFLLGLLALGFPHIIGVGYETTSAALTGQLGLQAAIVFAMVKTLAIVITMGGRMGGGVFSPSLMIGALTGLAFGHIATAIVPEASGSEALYALAGMGAVAAAVLGAPISTTMIVFELTGDWQTGLAVMVAVSMSTALASKIVHRSFFLTQLERKNIHLAAGPQAYLLSMFSVSNVMRRRGSENGPNDEAIWAAVADGHIIDGNATLERAMPMLESRQTPFLAVVRMGSAADPPEILGALYHFDALRAYNRALAATAAEEHS